MFRMLFRTKLFYPHPPPQMSLLKEEYCVVLCEMELNHKQVRAFSQRIDEDYTLHM